MENQVKPDLRISGAGSSTGGSYNEVRISGAGDVNGDIDCNMLRVSGAADIKGNVKTKSAHISGASDIKGNVTCEELIEISGASDIKGDVVTKKIRISGGSDIKGSLHAEEVDITGAIDIKEDCEAERFKASGAFEIGGLLNAGTIDIRIGGKCRVSEMGGEKIDVRLSDNGIFALKRIVSDLFNLKDALRAVVIEGDDIYLESTIAKVVRGNNVTIGPNCEIELIEYKNQISINSNARVKEQKKLE
jgi:cytoskeletal protein CcmA (bactofilin family)